MKLQVLFVSSMLAAALPVQAQTEIQWWHAMPGANGEWINDLAKGFNESQKEYKVIPTFKGSYEESMPAAIAAFRAGNAPHILQVFEVGTATMMAAKGAIKPVAEVMKEGGGKFDPNAYISAVAGYYTAPNGQMLSFPFNSSTTVFYYNKDAFKAAGIDPNKAPATWPEVALAAAKLKAAGVTPLAVGAKDDWTLPIVHEALAGARFGGAKFQTAVASGAKDFTDPDWVASVKVVGDLKAFMPKSVTGVAVTDAQTLFASGQAAMYPGGSYDLASLQKANPEMKIGVLQVPPAPFHERQRRGFDEEQVEIAHLVGVPARVRAEHHGAQHPGSRQIPTDTRTKLIE